MSTNTDQGLLGCKHPNPLTALLCFGTTLKIDSSNYTINSIWLSEQLTAQICNFGRKHQRYLAAMQYKIREDYLG